MEKLIEVLYFFEKSDGSNGMFSIEDARALNDEKVNARIETIMLNKKNKRMKKDGFTPGWQENISEYAGGPMEYARKLKEKGLVEIGYDYIPQEGVSETNHFANSEVFEELVKTGEYNQTELDAIKSGDYLKDIELHLGEE